MRVGAVALIAWLAAAGCGDARDVDERVEAVPGGLLEVDLDRGDGLRLDPGSLVVQSHAANEVRVIGEAHEWGASGVRFRIDRLGDAVRVQCRVRGPTSWLFGGPRVEVRIFVPREYSVDVRSTAGAVRLEDTTGALRVRTVGDVEIARAEGPVRVRAEGDLRIAEVVGDVDVRLDEGDIEARAIQGSVELRTGRGQIEVSHLQGALVARTARGSLDLRDLAGPVEAVTERGGVFASFVDDPEGRIETSRGSVEVLLPEGAQAQLEAISRRGGVELHDGFRVPGGRAPDRIAGPLNGGGSPLRLFTARGGVHVRPR
jgi:hypothetical protein